MIAASRISPPRPLVQNRAFGLIATGWPRHRRGRREDPVQTRVPRPERVFRRPRQPQPDHPPAMQPVNVSIAHMTLAPRFAFLWQSFAATAAAVVAHQTAVGAHPRAIGAQQTAVGALLRMPAAGLRSPSGAQATETLIGRAERIFLTCPIGPVTPRRRFGTIAAPRNRTNGFGPTRSFASPRLVPTSPEHSADAPRARWPFRSGQLRCAAPRVVALSETTLRRTAEVLCTTVVRRVRRRLVEVGGVAPAAAPALPVSRQAHEPSANRVFADQGPAAARVAAPSAHTSTERRLRADPTPLPAPSAQVPTGGRPGAAAAPFPVPSPYVPTERRFRAEPAPAPAPAVSPPVRAAEPKPPAEIDIAKLDRVLWQRFEKRVRIEQERRGRR